MPGETDTIGNTYTNGYVIVAMVGDLTGPENYPDRKCDMRDIYLVARGFGAEHVTDPNDPRHCQYWHTTPCGSCPHTPNADINNDGKVDMKDVYVVARNFGKTSRFLGLIQSINKNSSESNNVCPLTIHTLTSTPYDLNGDGKVDIDDLVIAMQFFGSYSGHPRWNPPLDFNLDNNVDIRDCIMLEKHFGQIDL